MKRTDPETRRLTRVYDGYGRGRKARAWSAANPGNRAIRDELADRLLARLPASPDGRAEALDVGCGGGWWLARLRAAGWDAGRLHGVDLLAARVEAARRAVPGARVARADARRLPYGDGRCAVVTQLTALSSLASRADAAAALREAWRVLAPGGALLVYEPRWPTPRNPHTIRIDRRLLAATLGRPVAAEPLTLLPPLARRLGPLTGRAYPALSRLRALRTHALLVAVKPAGRPPDAGSGRRA